MDEVVNEGKGIAILSGDQVERAIVLYEAKLSVLLLDEEVGLCTGTGSGRAGQPAPAPGDTAPAQGRGITPTRYTRVYNETRGLLKTAGVLSLKGRASTYTCYPTSHVLPPPKQSLLFGDCTGLNCPCAAKKDPQTPNLTVRGLHRTKLSLCSKAGSTNPELNCSGTAQD